MRLYKLTGFAPNIVYPLVDPEPIPKGRKPVHRCFPTAQKLLQRLATYHEDEDWFVTTGLDNDDAIGINYVEEVQNFVVKHRHREHPYLLDVPRTLYMSPDLKKVHIHNNEPGEVASVSCTLVEQRTNKPKTIYVAMHGRLRRTFDSWSFLTSPSIHTMYKMNSSDHNWKNYRQPRTENWREEFQPHFPWLKLSREEVSHN
jgi:hypothetical protein